MRALARSCRTITLGSEEGKTPCAPGQGDSGRLGGLAFTERETVRQAELACVALGDLPSKYVHVLELPFRLFRLSILRSRGLSIAAQSCAPSRRSALT